MPKLKVYTANLGFYEVAVAARSQKMALAHWGAKRDLFREGIAKETNDPKAVDAAMRKVGMVVRRPIGSTGAFEERADAERTLIKRLGAPKKTIARKPVRRKQKGKRKSR
jgi:colicin import membrane protein